MKKDLIYNLIILDESGSMYSAYDSTIQAFNQFLGNIKSSAAEFSDQEHKVTFLSFNTEGLKYLCDAEDPDRLKDLNRENYRPHGGTPLYDAIGFSVNKLDKQLENMENPKVLVSIFTDGYENESKEFTGSQIRNLVETLEEKGWTFTYIGADHDVTAAATSMNIKNSRSFGKNLEGMTMMFFEELEDRKEYLNKVRAKDQNLKEGYFRKK